MSIVDDIFAQAEANQEVFRAGVLAGDASGESARKLATLIRACKRILIHLPTGPEGMHDALLTAIEEAER